MNRKSTDRQRGSVLVIALLTIAILTLLCATSLYITSQGASATNQTTSWEQSLSGAEAAVDNAMNALNTNSWSGWYTVTSSSLPTAQPSPSGTPNATSTPGSGTYNYYSSSFSLQGEASNTITWWVTVDNGSVAPMPSPSPGLVNGGQQAYRIRAAAVVDAPGPVRVSNNRLDNDLRKVSLRFDRTSGGAVSTPRVTRRIEVVATAVTQNGWGKGLTMAAGVSMSGGGFVDSFNSNNGSRAWTVAYRDTSYPQVAGIVNNTWNSDLRNTYIYGGLTYSGTTVKNTTNVEGGIQTPYPFPGPSPAATPPSGAAWTVYTGGGSNPPHAGTFTAGPATSPAYIKVNGDLTVSSSGQPLHIQQANGTQGNNAIYIWVTGKLTTSGSGYINQDTTVKATWYVGGDITFSGGSYLNGNPGGSENSNPPYSPPGYAGNLTIYGLGSTSNKFTDSGSALFTGVVDAPNYSTTISGSGDFTGAMIGNTLTLSGSGNFHYDEALGSGGANGVMFTFSRWFEDNSDPSRGVIY
jgi:Tfp pilus assembly protein PilX